MPEKEEIMVATDTKAIEKVSNFMRSGDVKARFAEVVGDRNAGAYISSVMLAVANDESGKLAKCTPTSIYVAALRAATLRLSVDPSMGQAYLVAFGDKATLVVGYKGLQDMAVRTNKYRYMNVAKIYEGETVEPDRISGLITLKSLGGKRTSNKVAGYLAAFEMLDGYAHTLYMTIDEIHEHAKKYSRGYDYKNQKGEFTSLWHKNPDEMERKTPLRLLLRKYGYMDPNDAAVLEEIESEMPIDAEFTDSALPEPAQEEPEAPKSEAQFLTEIGQGDEAVSDTMWQKWQTLCQKCENLDMPYPLTLRADYNNKSLAAAYKDLDAAYKAKKSA
jgi:recombination protein RecT